MMEHTLRDMHEDNLINLLVIEINRKKKPIKKVTLYAEKQEQG
jgi:hypothetical protein